MKNTFLTQFTMASMAAMVLATAPALAAQSQARTHAQAPAPARPDTAFSEEITTHQAAFEHHSGVAYSLGISTISPIPPILIAAGTNVAATVGGGGSLTSVLQLTPVDALQLLAAIPGTVGGFNLGLGGLYKRTLFGNESAGFHAGAGVGLGTVSYANSTNFAASIPVLVGIHYTVSGTQVAFHFDGGGAFSVVSISGVNGIGGSTTTNFTASPFSTVLGASVVYLF